MSFLVELVAIRVIATHIRNLTTLTDDLPAVVILMDCADRLTDRTNHLLTEAELKKEKNNHDSRK